MNGIAEGAIAMTPLFVGFATHGLCMRVDLLRWSAHPISVQLFGKNKTYRGILCVALGTAVGFVLIRPSLLARNYGLGQLASIGFLMGIAAMFAELPNSFIKRRSGIAPGTQAEGIRGAAFHLLDQIDVVFGAWLLLAWLTTPTWTRIGGSLVMMYVGHQVVSMVGYRLGMRRSAR